MFARDTASSRTLLNAHPLRAPTTLAFALMAAPVAQVSALPAAAGGGSVATAGSYPDRPLRMIVPNPPGGGADILGRLMSQQLAERLRQPVVVENRPGAGGTIGMAALAQSAADGYTLAMGVTAALAIAPALYGKTGYDAEKDIEPIALVGGEVSLMFANALSAPPHVRSGRLRALAVTSSGRSSAFPDVPSVAESGLLAEGADIATGTPERFRAFMREAGVRWGGAVRQSGARID